MAKHRIRRWLQFGVLDLLILTTIAGIVASLSQPVRTAKNERNTVEPWIFGEWMAEDSPSKLELYPDGSYSFQFVYGRDGTGWTIAPRSSEQCQFVLWCGTQQFMLRRESIEIMELWTEDGAVHKRMQQFYNLRGPMLGTKPYGKWTAVSGPKEEAIFSLEYRNGEVADCRGTDGTINLWMLNHIRSLGGLRALTERDFPNGSKIGVRGR